MAWTAIRSDYKPKNATARFFGLGGCSGFSGAGSRMVRGTLTSPLTLNTPAPMPPTFAGPHPGPSPEPTPPPDPDPIPPPKPVPLDGGAGMFDIGSPRLGAALASLICGGTTTVGSAVSLGCSFRTTTTGGVTCSIDCFGRR